MASEQAKAQQELSFLFTKDLIKHTAQKDLTTKELRSCKMQFAFCNTDKLMVFSFHCALYIPAR